MYVFFLSGNFLTSTIILLIFIRGVNLREKGGKERVKKEKDEVCMRERERVVIMLNLIKWVPHFSKYLQKCYWVILFENWKLVEEVF